MAALGLMAGVAVQLGIAAVLLIRYKVNSTWLIIGGGVLGLIYSSR